MSLFRRAMIAAVLALVATPAFAEKRVALVVGNSAYRHVSPLANPSNDARLMANTLRQVGFTLIGDGPLLDLDKAAFDAAVQNFGNQLLGADVGLFYYAGHGVQIRGSNYLVPVSANPTKESDVDFQMLDMNLVLRQMEGASTKLNLVLLDACRNNPFGGRGLRSASSGLTTMQAPEGTLISFATQPGNVAMDGAGGNSPYTLALADAVRRPGLDVFRTFNEVGLTVKKTTGGQQQPWISLSPIGGSFYFAGPGAAAAVTTPPSTTPAPPVPPPVPPVDPAATAWAAVRDTTNMAVLVDFNRRYPDTVYGALARARIEEMRRVAALPPPATNDTSPRPGPGIRFGAIALSPTRLAWGEGHEYATREQAEDRALLECRKYASDCQKLRWVSNGCHALATGNNVWGHASDVDVNEARNKALAECRKRGNNCNSIYAGCSKP